MTRTAAIAVSVCICTRDRPAELARLLASIPRESAFIMEVLVSDDGEDEGTTRKVTSAFPGVTWIRGPSKGVAANRNNVALAAAGSHVWFVDDDACVGMGCLQAFVECIEQHPAPERLILTGLVMEGGAMVWPHEQTFLGHQGVRYSSGQRLMTVVLSNAVFPRAVFDRLRFDERLRSVCEEADFTTRAVAQGFEILCCPRAVAEHSPPGDEAGEKRYGREFEVARVYVTAKRRALTEKSYVRAAIYLGVAIPHMIGGRLRRGGVKTLPGSLVGVMEVSGRLLRSAFGKADGGGRRL